MYFVDILSWHFDILKSYFYDKIIILGNLNNASKRILKA